jgi:cell division protein FtsN
MTMRKTARRKKPRHSTKPAQMPGWVWGMLGLTIGLSVAAAIYVKDRKAQPTGPVAAKTAPPSETDTSETSPEAPEKTEPRFKFYDMLPNFEVVIPEEDFEIRREAPSRPVESPGIYVLQAGSFSSFTDADRRKAQLAMLGVGSRIQKVAVDDKVYHRVRIGPVESLERLNELREQMRRSAIEVMVIRVGE